MEPNELMVSLACEIARRSPCAKSKRGVVIYERGHREDGRERPGIIHGTGFNGPPRPFKCDGSAACRKDCGVVCMHAEMRALLGAQVPSDFARATGEPELPVEHLELVHVKIDTDGELVAGRGPCCELCSRMVLDVGIATVWLYEAPVHVNYVEVQALGWRKYTAAEFHRKTLETLGFHISKEENVHRFYPQHRSRYCAACGEESYHPVHTL